MKIINILDAGTNYKSIRNVSCDTNGDVLYIAISDTEQIMWDAEINDQLVMTDSSTQTEEIEYGTTDKSLGIFSKYRQGIGNRVDMGVQTYDEQNSNLLPSTVDSKVPVCKANYLTLNKFLGKLLPIKSNKVIDRVNFINGYDFLHSIPQRRFAYAEPKLTSWVDGSGLPDASLTIVASMYDKLEKTNLKAYLKKHHIDLNSHYLTNINSVTSVYLIKGAYTVVINNQSKTNCADLIHICRIFAKILKEREHYYYRLLLDVATSFDNVSAIIEFITHNEFSNIKWVLNVPINNVTQYKRELSSRWIVEGPKKCFNNTNLVVKLPTKKPIYLTEQSNNYYYKNAVMELLFFMEFSTSFIVNDLDSCYKQTINSLPYSATSLASKHIYVFDNQSKVYVEEPAKNHLWGYDGFQLVEFNKEANNFNTFSKYIFCSAATEILLDYQIYVHLKECGVTKYNISKPDIIAIQGVPGCGKSTWILDNHSIGKDLVLSSTREGIKDIKNKVATLCQSRKIDFKVYENNYRTIASYLLNSKTTYKIVYIDEYMMVHAGFIGLVAMKSQCTKIFLMGDKEQIPFIDRLHYVNMQFYDPGKFISSSKYLNITYRCPADIVVALKHIYPDFHTTNGKTTSVNFATLTLGLEELPIKENTYYLTFTRADKLTLISKLNIPSSSKIMTVHEAQGLTTPNVVCVRLSANHINLYDSIPHAVVALTRHTNSFVYFAPEEGDLLHSLILNAKFATETQLIEAVKSDIKSKSEKPKSKLILPEQISRCSSNLTFYYQNVNKMSSKAAQFHNFVLKTQLSVYMICETSFNEDIFSAEFFPNDYVVYRCDRSAQTSAKKSGGGVLIAVHLSVASEMFLLTSSTIEQLCVKLSINARNIYIYLTYIPPNASTNVYMDCCESLAEIYNATKVSDYVLVVGDFNFPNINWTHDSEFNCFLPYNVNSEAEGLFIDTVLQLNLHQINGVANDRDRFLDLIFVNELNIFNAKVSLQPFVENDINHKSMEITLNVEDLSSRSNCHQNNKQWYYNFKKANINELKKYFEDINWEDVFECDDINECVDKYYHLVFRGFDLHVPISKEREIIYPPWYDNILINLKNVKNKNYKIMKKTNLEQDRLKFLSSSEDYDTYFNQRYKSYILQIQDKISSNPKNFWNFFNSKRDVKGYPATMNFNEAKSSDPLEIANFFAKFFQSVYKSEDIETYTNPPGGSNNLLIPLPTVMEEDIISALSSFGDGCGPDGIPSSILKNCGHELKKPLSLLFNKSLNSGKFPCKWKTTRITPIFKSGHRGDVTCYRGVTSISSAPKLLELIVCNSFKKVVSQHISIHQHGFMPGRSTSTNLIEFASKTIQAIEKNDQVDVIYTDFSKAFDSVSHKKALESLYKFGFSSSFINFIKSYLTARTQYVEVGGQKSTLIQASSGVPQGSHIGPWFFIIFIDEITEIIKNSQILIFADDVKLYKTLRTSEDAVNLQEDVNKLSEWCDRNLLQLNINKCKVMSFHRKKNPTVYNYHIDNNVLQRVVEIKDLGVTFVGNMTFNKHMDLCIAKSNSMLGFIKRWTHEIQDQHTLLVLYFAYIRSHLEYAVSVWCPYYAKHFKRIESVQKKYLLYLLKKDGWDYDEDLPYHENVARLPPYNIRCQNLKISTLEARRGLLGASMVGNTLLGHVDSPFILENIQLQVPSRSLRQHQFLHLDTHRTNYGENEPLNRMAKLFNSIDHLFDFNITKEQLKRKLKDHFLQE